MIKNLKSSLIGCVLRVNWMDRIWPKNCHPVLKSSFWVENVSIFENALLPYMGPNSVLFQYLLKAKKPEVFFSKSWNFLWKFWNFWPSQMNFGKVQGLYDVLLLNYHITWGRFGPSKLGHNFFVFQIIVTSGVIFAMKSCKIN